MQSHRLSPDQLRYLESAFHAGAAESSSAMSTWLSVPSLVLFEALDQQPLAEAGDLLGDPDSTACVSAMQLQGSLSGLLVFAFDDSCGLALADLLLGKTVGTADQWGEVEQSAAQESANIIGCAYLNGMSDYAGSSVPALAQLIPSPPQFRRDFAESLMQSLVMPQAMEANTVFLARARFEIEGEPLNWTLLLIPDASSLRLLHEQLPDE